MQEDDDEESARQMREFLFPKGASGWAIATGVSVVLIGLGIGIPFLLPFGILALRDISRHPEKTGKGVAWLGTILGAIAYIIAACGIGGCLQENWEDWRKDREKQRAEQEKQKMAELLAKDVRAVNKKLRAKEERKAGDTKTIKLPGGAEMEMVWCPPGMFLMGSPEDEEGRDNDETLHQVTLTKGFWMAKTEVTQAQWKSVMGNNPSEHKGDDLPVENVSWNDAQEFCRKAGLRLPTEAQWEYACRAGSTGRYAGTGKLDDMGWYDRNSGHETHPVAKKKPNAWGLYDMHGNVWEWCQDWDGDYPNHAVQNPQGASSGSNRIIRGGGGNNSAGGCRSANHNGNSPGFRHFRLGFRPSRGLPE
jgi:formylglycine-generating enzyme required for sulfatase activity